MRKKRGKVKVEIKSRGDYRQVYSGYCLKTATNIKNMLRSQSAKLHVIMVQEV